MSMNPQNAFILYTNVFSKASKVIGFLNKKMVTFPEIWYTENKFVNKERKLVLIQITDFSFNAN